MFQVKHANLNNATYNFGSEQAVEKFARAVSHPDNWLVLVPGGPGGENSTYVSLTWFK